MNDKTRVLLGVVLCLAVACLGLVFPARTVIPGPNSKAALLANQGEALAFANGISPQDTVLVILTNQTLLATDAQFQQARDSLFNFLKGFRSPADDSGVFQLVKTAGHSLLGDEHFISADKHHIAFIGDTVTSVDSGALVLKNLPQQLRVWNQSFPDFKIEFLSNGTLSNELFDLINKDLDTSLLYTIPITIFILLWTFRSIAASVLTISLTGLSLSCSLGVSALMSRWLGPISATASQLVVLLVLAIGTDYALFFISRVRRDVQNGKSYNDAILHAQGLTGRAIFWSGVTVATSLVGMLLMQDTVLTSMALVSILSVGVTLAVTLILLPALLRLLQDRIELGRIRQYHRQDIGFATTWLVWSLRKPLQAIGVSIALLLIPFIFCFQLRLGSTVQPEMMPEKMQTVVAANTLKEHFPELAGADLSVILQSPRLNEQDLNGELQEFFDALQSYPQIHGPIKIQRSDDLTTQRYLYIVTGSSLDTANTELVAIIKDKLIPNYLTVHGITGLLSGQLNYDLIATVLALSFIFLLLVFRSIVIPIKAIILNIISTGASFGVLVIVFQITGFHYGVVESFVPALLFCVLFGLSMDYHLLLISRISEEVRKNHSIQTSVEIAIQDTYGVITSAAVIMVSVFTVIASLELPIMKQLGVGLACAVLLDATIIRCVLLPASMVLLGKWNWYLPSWLTWIPSGKP